MAESDVEAAMKAYAPLFQPLKDLAKNWSIDMEKCLEGFVEWMRRVQEVERNSGGHFNFAQAALVVAGGAEVYGRKVDYVHQLTLGFFEQLNEKAKKKKDGHNDGADDVDDDLNSEAPTMPDDPCEWVDISKFRAADPKTFTLKRGACKPAKLLPLIPMELVPLTSEEKTNVPLYDSVNGKVLIGMKDDFRMNTAFIHKSGAMLLDLINERLINHFTTKDIVEEVTEIIHNLEEAGPADVFDAVQENMDTEPIGDARPSASQFEARRATQNTMPEGTLVHQRLTGLISDEEVAPGVACNAANLFENTNIESVDDAGDAYEDGEYEDDEIVEDHLPTDAEYFVEDDLEEVDIFTEYEARHAAQKVVKAYNFAANLIKRRLRKREKLGLNPEISFVEYMHGEVYRKSVKKIPKPAGTIFSDMPSIALSEYILKEQRRRNAFRSSLKRKNAAAEKETETGNEAVAVDANPRLEVVPDELEDDASDPEFFDDDASVEEAPQFEAVLENEDMVDSNFRNVLHPEPHVEDIGGPAEEMSFSARLRHYLEMYWAEGEEMHSKLDERVQNWEEKMTPLLEEEEKRRAFDIHTYGSELLEKFHEIEEKRPFFDLIDGVPDYDFSRYFLSSLMLANTLNLGIEYSDKDFLACDDSEANGNFLGSEYLLELLKRERHHKAIEQSVT